MDWKACKEKRIAKEVSVDSELVKSLISTSKNKFKTAGMLKIDNITSSSVITLYYDSLRELLEALSLIKGFKIYNHECYTWFLVECLGKKELGFCFDRYRKIRNSVNYYGKELSLDEANQIMIGLKDIIMKMGT